MLAYADFTETKRRKLFVFPSVTTKSRQLSHARSDADQNP
jgi:hypothetical protein